MPWIIGGPSKSIEAINRSAKRDAIARSEERIQARRARVLAVVDQPAAQAVMGFTGVLAAMVGVGTIEAL